MSAFVETFFVIIIVFILPIFVLCCVCCSYCSEICGKNENHSNPTERGK